MDIRPEFSIIPISDFNRVAQENEVFFWHFVNRTHNDLGCNHGLNIKPLSEVGGKTCTSGLSILVEEYNIKVYESIIEDSLPFLYRFNYAGTQLYNPKCGCYGPKFIGFRNGKKIAGTAQEVYCYCLEGITEVIHLTDPTIFTNNG
jgi:hypothetical protein